MGTVLLPAVIAGSLGYKRFTRHLPFTGSSLTIVCDTFETKKRLPIW